MNGSQLLNCFVPGKELSWHLGQTYVSCSCLNRCYNAVVLPCAHRNFLAPTFQDLRYPANSTLLWHCAGADMALGVHPTRRMRWLVSHQGATALHLAAQRNHMEGVCV